MAGVKGGMRAGFAALGAMGLMASSAAVAAPADFAAKADAYLKTAYPADGPGVAAIVVDDGKVVYSGGQGLADVEAKQAITADTVFRLGSITKQFTAAVILQLAEEEKLSLSDPLSKYLPDFPKPGADATIAQLLNHTSGIKSYTGIPGFMAEKTALAFNTEELVAAFSGEPADFAVGTKHRYNNSGYVLLGAVIEKVTGKPWHAASDERIGRPLGLETIRYGELESSMPNMAAGYTDKDGETAASKAIHMSVPHAAGALIGSVEDLAAWAEALHKGKVLKAASYKQMIAPTELPDGETVPYGYGLRMDALRGRDTIGHGGGIFGFDTASLYIPGDDVFVAVFANSDQARVDPDVALTKLAAMAVGDPIPEHEKVAFSPEAVEPLLGLYSLDEGERRFFLKDGRLFTRRSGGSDMEVFAAGGDRFFYGPESLTWFEIERDTAGKHRMAMFHNGSSKAEMSVRSGPVPVETPVVEVERGVLERYAGSYRASLGMAMVTIGDDGGLSLALGPQQPIRLLPTSETEFRTQGVDAKIVFHGEPGKVSHLVIHQGGQEIRAEREQPAS